MAKQYQFPKESFGEKFNEIYFSSLEKIKENKEYNDIIEKIILYKNILKNNYHVNEETIEELVSLIQEKIELEYENAIKDTIKFLDKEDK